MAKRVSLINMKGGVGKSTLTVNLAWHFAEDAAWHRRVLVVDLDPQFNASQYLLGASEYERIIGAGKPTIWDVFERGTRTPAGTADLADPRAAIHRRREFAGGGVLDLIPSRLELALSLKYPGNKERQLSRILDEVQSDYDLILVDCAPTESMLTTAAYFATDLILVPVKPEYLSTIGLPLLVNSMKEFKLANPDKSLDLVGIVFNSASDYLPEESLSKSEVRELSARNGWYVFENQVGFSRSYPKGAREGSSIRWTSYARWRVVRNFGRVADEFAHRIGL